MTTYDEKRLERAVEFAKHAHAGQVDKAGVDYFKHVSHVMARCLMHSISHGIVGVLHDTVEDRSKDVFASDYLRKMTDDLDLTDEESRAIAAITRGYFDSSETVRKYLQRVAKDKLAFEVKRVDLQHNQNHTRLYDTGISEEEALASRAYYLEKEAILIKERLKFLGV